jgi:pantetheine-phosphate adenylyltransferase
MYTGTFDPVTLGHLDIVKRAAAIFERVIVAVYAAPSKNLLFNTDERVSMFRQAIEDLPNVEVTEYTGLSVEYARTMGAQVIVRGLRSGSDFEYEFEMAYMNKKLAPDIELVCLIASLDYQYVSSSLLKEVVGLGGAVEDLLPPKVTEAVKQKLRSRD